MTARTAEPVYDCCQIQEAALHTNIRDVRAPYLIRMNNLNVPQQVRVNLVIMVLLARVRFRINGLKSHQVHQSGNSFGIDMIVFIP